MKLLILSDIHANSWALEAILHRERDCDIILCAGDLVDYGTDPASILKWAMSGNNKIIVQGNHDARAVNVWRTQDYNHMPPDQYKWVHYNCQRLNGEQIQYLAQLPGTAFFNADGWTYMLQHAYHEYDIIESREAFNRHWNQHAPQSLKDAPRRRMIFGHTHRQCVHILEDGMEWLNPGSISYRRPDDHDKEAHYMVIEDGNIRFGHLPYDRSPLLEEALRLNRSHKMMETELQVFMFFFGNAQTKRDPLP